MPAFAWRAASPSGRTVRGVEEAESAPALERTLGARGLYPLHVAPATAADAEPRRAGFRGRRADVAEAVRYLATLLEAGFPLDRALAAVSRVAARRDVAGALADARERVRGGARLEQAMAAHPRVFPRFAVGMVRAGERGGQLAPALDRLAGQLEREQALRARLTSALVYPAVMTAVGAGRWLSSLSTCSRASWRCWRTPGPRCPGPPRRCWRRARSSPSGGRRSWSRSSRRSARWRRGGRRRRGARRPTASSSPFPRSAD